MMGRSDRSATTERHTLWIVLILNAGISAAFFLVGLTSDSSALIANGVDNLSDALVYLLSLIALSRGAVWKTRVATVSGTMLLLFAVGILVDVGRRYLYGSEPIGSAMMAMSAVAAAVNYICLRLLQRLEKPDVALRAATTFSFNDFISNGGILVAGGLVLWLGGNWPDLIVGVMTALIAIKGGIEILKDARAEAGQRAETAP
ncbi:cation transporter [Sphingomonas sp. C3-2]|uniref:cation transporter n=1 Tax=Sphingomonas sp. C3-2 TaxID=3062169 RepID=UPI00294B8A5F|nr:cation transporter [Sphingomonas sp. C3-2]WOK38334.1 cation transporter [Sphingomonas sp. C3-2]